MAWRDLARNLYPNCILASPASAQEIEEVQAALSVVMPDELKSLLSESNGIVDEWKQGPVLSTGEITSLNLDFRGTLGDIYPAFFSRLFIAKGAGGDLWGYKVDSNAVVTDPKIYVWAHELAEEEPEEETYFVQTESLRAFLEWHLTKLSVI